MAGLKSFSNSARGGNAPVDFVTTHHYPTDALGDEDDDTETQLANSQLRAPEWLSEDGRERTARSRCASACVGCDLQRQGADHQVKRTLHKEADAGQPLDRAETVH